MQPELLRDWKTVSKLLDEALDLEPAARDAWLSALPAEFTSLKSALAELLAKAVQQSSNHFGDPLPRYDNADAAGNDNQTQRHTGDEVGQYRLIREIGKGGMGSVWLADKLQGGAGMPVALKLPHVEGASSHIRERFEREREILAALNHPNIARLLEAGVTPEGQPYLAIEYVEGDTLLNHCNTRALPLHGRLRLFLQVLKAVEYAHAHLVIHRDLKPTNIVVTAAGDVKLLDFGIAKLLAVNATSTAETALTQQVGRVMTPDYASPEQVSGVPLTTASDVYSLGVVLYELLTGTRPYRLKRGSRAELEEAILTSDTQLPSNAVSEELVNQMRVPISRWLRLLRGDLDTITLEALHKVPGERYPGVDAFRQDIERYLDGRPVLARPESAWYRFGKFVTRNKLAVGAASAVIVALLLGMTASLWQARVAVREANKARTVQAFLTELFERNTRFQAEAAKARNKTVREVLVEASERVPSTFKDSPELRVELSITVAKLLNDVEEFERAANLFRDAISIAKANGMEASDQHVEALMGLTGALRILGKGPEAIAARDQALAVLDARGDKTSLLRARVSANSVSYLSQDVARETALINEALALFASRYPKHPEHFAAAMVLAQVYRSQGEWTFGEEYFHKAISLFKEVGSKDYVNFAAAHGWAGFCASKQGRIDIALKDFETGIHLLEENAGANALLTRFHRGLYARTLHAAGQRDESHRRFDELERTVVRDKPNAVDFDNAIYHADTWVEEGLPRKAIALLDSYADHHVELGKRFFPSGVRWATLLAKAHAMLGHAHESEVALKRIDDLPQQYSTPAAQLLDYKNDVSWILLASGRLDEAGTTLKFGEDHANNPLLGFNIGYVQLNIRAAEIAIHRGDFALALARTDLAQRHFSERAKPLMLPYLNAELQKVRGEALLGNGDAAAAAKTLAATVASMRQLQDAASPWLADTLVSSALAHRKLGQIDQAVALHAEARRILRQHPSLSPEFTARIATAKARSAVILP